MKKVKKEIHRELYLTKKDFDVLLRKEFSIKGKINYRFEEAGDFDRGTYRIKGINIWAVEKA